MKMKKAIRALDEKHRALWEYRHLWVSEPINEEMILVESQQGRSANGNMFYVLKELLGNPNYKKYTVLFSAKKDTVSQVSSFLAKNGLPSTKIVEIGSRDYIKALATAKYLFTDTAFPAYYIKKDGQILWNSWHGTPIKAMGRSSQSDNYKLGNIQKNLAFADYITFPNRFSASHIITDYMLENISKAELMFCGYPRNDAFFKRPSNSLASLPQLAEKKRLYAYMPTWRSGDPGNKTGVASIELLSHLYQFEQRLHDDELLLVNIHPLEAKEIDISGFDRIEFFPPDFEIYEVLNVCDALVTDYSSVMFDFLTTRKPIVLFPFDKDLYASDRGLYPEYDALPFPEAKNVSEVISLLREEKPYDDQEALDRFCPHERGDSTVKTLSHIILGEKNIHCEPMPSNNLPNVLIYAGNMARNGITSSLIAFLETLDTSKRNYILTFNSTQIRRNKQSLNRVPPSVSYIPCMGKNNLTPQEKIVQLLYSKRKISFKEFNAHLKEPYAIDFKRLYGDIPFSAVIQFNGYDYKKIFLFSQFDGVKTIFVHSNMEREAKLKRNTRLDIMQYAYQEYSHVAIVSESLRSSVQSISDNKADIIHVPNAFNYRKIREMSTAPLEFDKDTLSNVTLDQLNSMLEGQTIMSIGRFSPEKQHSLLLKAFEKVWKTNPDLNLVIVGGGSHTDLYSETCEFVSELSCRNNVALIKNVSNPYTALARSSGFILSSSYEGFGLVILEADALGIPAVSTNIEGPRSIMESNGGTLVENSLEGIIHGLELLVNRKIEPMSIDFENYNAKALAGFEKIITGQYQI